MKEIKEKICKKCLLTKDISLFYIQKQKSTDGNITWPYFDCYCKNCRSKTSSDRRKNIKLQAIIYKGGKCQDCKYDNLMYVDVFDFHHLEPNEKDFTIAKSRKSFESIKNELDKCVLLCANCHRIRHAK